MNKYYVSQRRALMEGFDSIFADAESLLSPPCEVEDAHEVLLQTRPEFEVLIPLLPYIGGPDNPLTDHLVMSARFLAFFRVMRRFGHSPQQTYFALYRVVEQWLTTGRAKSSQLADDYRFSPLYLEHLRQHAGQSQRREYTGDWVYEVVEADGVEFDYGVDYVECGLCKFFRDQGESQLVPFMCALDYPLARACGFDLKRSMALGSGQSRCDFRLRRQRSPGEPDVTMQDIGVP
jgi:L-2-amino-thiazoline-4-carboxylic acid hydrolase